MNVPEGHMISRVETRLSDGSIRVSNGLTPETAKLLSKLHPNMFPPESLLEVMYVWNISQCVISDKML